MGETVHGTRAVAIVGPGGTGKTSLSEALLFAAGAIARLGAVEAGSSVGDASPEAPHLHFEIKRMAAGEGWWQGQEINPYPLLAGKPSGG